MKYHVILTNGYTATGELVSRDSYWVQLSSAHLSSPTEVSKAFVANNLLIPNRSVLAMFTVEEDE